MSFGPTADNAMDWLRSGALAPEEGVDPRAGGGSEEKDYRARCMREAFRSEAGQVALDTILQMSLFRPPVDHRLPNGETYLRFAQNREGQNQLAAGVLAYLDHADQLERSDRAPAPVSTEPPDLLTGRRGREPAGGAGGEPDPTDWWNWGSSPGAAVR